jgi:hypothetical protein
VFAQYLHGENTDFAYGNKGGLFGQATAVTIFRDNAYLPENIRQIMVAENRQSFTFKRQGSVLDLGDHNTNTDKSVLNSITTGFNWKLDRPGLFSGWAVDGYYQYGHNARQAAQIGLRVDRIFAAIDAVRDPATGRIVCRTSLFNNQFPGCQPLNLFGRGNASAAALDYVTGFEPGQQINTPVYFADSGFTLGQTDSYTSEEAKVSHAKVQQHVAEISANGQVYKGWGAGPITAALGVSYRRESIRQIVPRSTTNRAPLVLRDTAPPVLTLSWMIFASPVAGSSCMTLPASLLANSMVPFGPAIGPSALLPSQAQTVFQLWPAAITPGMAVDGPGNSRTGGSVAPETGMAKGLGGVLHLATSAA